MQNQIVSYLVLRDAVHLRGEGDGRQVSDKDVDKQLTQLIKQYYKGDKTKYRPRSRQQGVTDDAAPPGSGDAALPEEASSTR